jgi:integrase
MMERQAIPRRARAEDQVGRANREPRLDQRAIERALKTGDRSVDQVLKDHEVRGLRLIVRKQSAVWWLPFRPAGFADPTSRVRHKQRWEKLGDLSELSLVEARRVAKRIKAAASEGRDPKAERAAKRDAVREAERRAKAEAASQLSCMARLKDYRAILTARGRSTAHVRDELGQVVGALVDMGQMQRPKQGEEPQCTIAPCEITRALIDKMLANAPAGSRRARFGSLSRFLSWAMKGEDKRPATEHFERHERPAAVESRHRWLRIAEIAAIWHACDNLRSPVLRDLIRFMISTPARAGEAATLCWRHVDLDAREWSQPAKLTKNKTPHVFWLNDRAMEILSARRQTAIEAGHVHDDDLVFPSPLESRVFTGWSKVKLALDRASGVHDWRFHDFRRTCATHLSEVGFDPDLIDGLLNHRQSQSRGGVKGIYNRSVRTNARARALACWSWMLDAFLAGRQPDLDAFDTAFDAARAAVSATVGRSRLTDRLDLMNAITDAGIERTTRTIGRRSGTDDVMERTGGVVFAPHRF